MKKTIAVFALAAVFASCNNEKKSNTVTSQDQDTTSLAAQEKKVPAAALDSINWEKVPEIKNIGDFPFFKPSAELKLVADKDHLTELIDYAKMENYTGSGVYTTRGKLEMMSFRDQADQRFNKLLFDDEIDQYLVKIGAEKIYKGDYPKNKDEGIETRLKENMWSGKKYTLGIADDEPFGVYAFKTNTKKYIFSFQSNSAEGKVFVMELK